MGASLYMLRYYATFKVFIFIAAVFKVEASSSEAFKRESFEALRANLPYLLIEKYTYTACLGLSRSLPEFTFEPKLYFQICKTEYPGLRISPSNPLNNHEDKQRFECDANFELAWINGMFQLRESISKGGDVSFVSIKDMIEQVQCGPGTQRWRLDTERQKLKDVEKSFRIRYDESLFSQAEEIIEDVEKFTKNKMSESEALASISTQAKTPIQRGYYHRYLFSYIEKLARSVIISKN